MHVGWKRGREGGRNKERKEGREGERMNGCVDEREVRDDRRKEDG